MKELSVYAGIGSAVYFGLYAYMKYVWDQNPASIQIPELWLLTVAKALLVITVLSSIIHVRKEIHEGFRIVARYMGRVVHSGPKPLRLN